MMIHEYGHVYGHVYMYKHRPVYVSIYKYLSRQTDKLIYIYFCATACPHVRIFIVFRPLAFMTNRPKEIQAGFIFTNCCHIFYHKLHRRFHGNKITVKIRLSGTSSFTLHGLLVRNKQASNLRLFINLFITLCAVICSLRIDVQVNTEGSITETNYKRIQPLIRDFF